MVCIYEFCNHRTRTFPYVRLVLLAIIVLYAVYFYYIALSLRYITPSLSVAIAQEKDN